MARVLTTKDAYAIINLLAKEATGQNGTVQAVDPSTFVSVGETILASGVENTLSTLALVLGRTFMAVRPYEAKLKIVNALNSGIYANRVRKISFYSKEAVIDGASNTDLKTNFAMGYDNGTNSGNSVASMWEQSQPVPLTLHLGGSSEWQDCITIYEKQLQVAFSSERDFLDFISGIMTERGNDIEQQKEAFNRMNLINFITGVYSLNQSGSVINMTQLYNDTFGTNYTSAALRTTYIESFTKFFVATVKTISDDLEYRSKKYHWSPTKTVNGVSYSLLRHTPKSKQKMMLYKPFWNQAEAIVMPEIFNDQYLKLDNFEGVQFWQNSNEGSKVSAKPAIPNTADPTAQTAAGSTITLDYVLGLIFDEDALMIDYQLEDSAVTPKEARKHYHNIWNTYRFNAINDFTENAVLFVMYDTGGND